MKPFKNLNNLEMGIDEAGRGCLFGRVYVGGVILPYDFQDRLDEEFNKKLQLRDSKKVNEKDRKLLRKLIEERAIDYVICYAEHYEIDEYNILQTTLNTMHECVNQIKIKPNFLLVDGDKFIPYKGIKHECVKGGDNYYHSIAAASILAKEYRDEYIKKLCEEHPILKEYDIHNNKGYGTEIHRKKIKEMGNQYGHRKTFGICKTAKDYHSFSKTN